MSASIIPTELAPAPRARRVATYARVSSEDQAERGTIATQREVLERRVGSTPGVEVVGQFEDDGVSGTIAFADRPAGGRLMSLLRAGGVDELWCLNVDRLGRDPVDMLVLRRALDPLGVRIISMDQGEQGGLGFDINAVVAGYARETFLRLTRHGIDRNARLGHYLGGPVAYGFRAEGVKPGVRIVPDEREVASGMTAADVVRHMYRRVALDHWSCRRVADELNALGIPTLYAREGRGMRKRHVTGTWGEGRIRNMLVSPTYKGILAFGKRSSKPRELITAPCEPLVPEELWQAAQDVLASHRIAARNTERVYLLRGVMTCAHCGQRLVGSTNRSTTYYRCGGRRQGRGGLAGGCPGRDVKGEPIESIVWGDVERWLRDPGDLLDELDGRAERDAAEAKRADERAAVEAALERLEDQGRRIVRLAVEGVLADEDLVLERERVAAEADGLRARLEGLAPPATDIAPIEPGLLARLRARLDAGLTDAERQEIVSLLVPRIDVTTTLRPDGLKSTIAAIAYRCPVAAVQTRSGTGSSPRPAGTGPGSGRAHGRGRSPRCRPPGAAGARRGRSGRTPRARPGTARPGAPGSPTRAAGRVRHPPWRRSSRCDAVPGTAARGGRRHPAADQRRSG